MKTSKLKLAVVIGLLCCMAMGMSVMAFNEYYNYTIGPNEEKTVASFVPAASTIYLNTRPSAGGDVIIIIGGSSSTFPINTQRADWVVPVSNPSAMLTIKARAGSRGSSGRLHVWS